jgi:alkylation response protein AidB-like acyl-CoA dehydrogenase
MDDLAADTMETAQTDVCTRSQRLLARITEMIPQMQGHAGKLDRENAFPVAEFDELREIAALSAVVPERFGGLGFGTESKGTLGLFNLLRLIGRGNLAAGRVFEGHVNAIALVALYGSEEQLAKASQDASEGHLFAVWNTEPPEGLRVVGTNLKGSKVFCSAAGYATRALVTAKTENGESQMLLLSLERGQRTEPVELRPQGMRAAITGRMVFDGFPVCANAFIGQTDDYTKEPAFSAGAWRASAVTLGGLEALIEEARAQLVSRGRYRDPHQQARMGRGIIAQETARLWCRRAALIAEGSRAAREEKTAYVNLARIAIETATMDAMRLIQRSLGLAGFLEPNPIERLMRDLGTYLRQPAPDEALTEAAAWLLENPGGFESLES